jgi:hypothetical protein
MQNVVSSASWDFFAGLECGAVFHINSIVPRLSRVWSVLLNPSQSDNAAGQKVCVDSPRNCGASCCVPLSSGHHLKITRPVVVKSPYHLLTVLGSLFESLAANQTSTPLMIAAIKTVATLSDGFLDGLLAKIRNRATAEREIVHPSTANPMR